MERLIFGDIGLLCGVKGLIATVVLTAYQGQLSIWGRLALQMRTVCN